MTEATEQAMTKEAENAQPVSQQEPVREKANDKAQAEKVRERAEPEVTVEEFLDYVKGEVAETGRKLGYEVVVKKIMASKGTVMMYNPKNREGRVFGDPSEAPKGWITGDQMQSIWAEERAQAAREEEE